VTGERRVTHLVSGILENRSQVSNSSCAKGRVEDLALPDKWHNPHGFGSAQLEGPTFCDVDHRPTSHLFLSVRQGSDYLGAAEAGKGTYCGLNGDLVERSLVIEPCVSRKEMRDRFWVP
jgi:hypothetical protein